MDKEQRNEENGREVRSLPVDNLEVRTDEEGQHTIRGHAAVFDQFSQPIAGQFVEKVSRGAFSRALEEQQDVRALWNHDSALVLGRTKSGTLRLREDRQGLAVEIDPPDTQVGRDAVESIRRGDVDQMSFGFVVKQDSFEERGGPNGELVRTLEDVDLFDVSPVTYPAYEGTDVAVRSCEAWRQQNQPKGVSRERREYDARMLNLMEDDDERSMA